MKAQAVKHTAAGNASSTPSRTASTRRCRHPDRDDRRQVTIITNKVAAPAAASASYRAR